MRSSVFSLKSISKPSNLTYTRTNLPFSQIVSRNTNGFRTRIMLIKSISNSLTMPMSIFITVTAVFSFAWMSVVNFQFNQFLAKVPEVREETRLFYQVIVQCIIWKRPYFFKIECKSNLCICILTIELRSTHFSNDKSSI